MAMSVDRTDATDGPTRPRRPVGGIAGTWSALDDAGMRRFWVGAAVLVGGQLLLLAAYSGYLFHRFDLTDDFATYSQAWWLIGHGHLDPVDTIQVPNYPFWQSHFELAMWPIALVGRLWSDPIQLLWLQDAAMAAAEWIAAAWVAAVSAGRLTRYRSTVALSALVFLMVNPWWYLAASFDVHFETLGLPFAVWSAYALWRGRFRTALVVGLVAMLFGDVVTVLVLCVGIAGLLSGRVRRQSGWGRPLILAGAAAAWLGVIAVVGGNKGSGLVANYGYLVGAGPTSSSAYVVERLLLHPLHVARVIVGRRAAMGRVLASAGLVGVLSPWGFAVAVGTLGPAALNGNLIFLSPTIAFQTLAVIPFVLVGSVLVLVRLATGATASDATASDAAGATSRGDDTGSAEPTGTDGVAASPLARARPRVAIALSVLLVVLSLCQNLSLFGGIGTGWWKVDAPAAAALSRGLSKIPGDAEVIASQGVIGRFAGRRYVYPFLADPQGFPVRSGTVVFVIAPSQGIESVTSSAAQQAIDGLSARPGVTVLERSSGVTVLEWAPPEGTTGITLPG